MSRTGENIYKRKDGRWEARYIDSYDGNGKAKYKYLYAPTYTEVKAKLLKAQNYADLSSDLEKTKDKEKYEYWLDAWLHAKRLGVKESTYIRYRNTIENHIKPDLGKYPINKISTSLMEQFVSRKLQNGRIDGNGGLSPKSMSDIMVIVKESFKYAHSYGVSVVCSFERISFKKNAQEMRVLSPLEEQRLLSVLFKDFDSKYARIAVDSDAKFIADEERWYDFQHYVLKYARNNEQFERMLKIDEQYTYFGGIIDESIL